MELFCSVCGDNPVTLNSKVCSKCKYKCCDSCLKTDLCKDCLDDLCPICSKNFITGDFNNEKYCVKCDRVCCLECINLTGCQTTLGICKECFDCLCISCNKKNLTSNLYLLDDSEYKPICENCKT
jgi:hypothetical protein